MAINKNNTNQEDIETQILLLEQKIDILKVRYEQFFLGNEKIPPTTLRTETVRIIRHIENLQIRNTALKFKLRSAIQKFNTYSTYWNRTMREIEDGKYKRGTGKHIVQTTNTKNIHTKIQNTNTETKNNHEANLYQEMNAARKSLGMPPQNIDQNTFNKKIQLEKQKLQTHFPDKKINFRIVQKNGKPQIQPYIEE